MNKILYIILSVIIISAIFLTLFNCCNMGVQKFKPEIYFGHTDYYERSMANAIYYGNKKLVRENIKLGKVDLNKPGDAGFTYLLYAIYIEQYDIAKVLLENGADPNILCIVKHPDGTSEKLTPLSVVCGHHWYPIKYIKLLVENGANVNDPDKPALSICILLSGKDQKKVRYLIEHGADVNQIYGDCSPMQDAVSAGRLELVDLLWEYGADPLYVGKKGNSLAFKLQKIVDNKLGTPEYIDHAKKIMERLKKLGVQFPVSLQPVNCEEEKPDSTLVDPDHNETGKKKKEWKWM